MSKHLFSVRSYGVTHVGEFVRQTEKSMFYRSNGVDHRCLKDGSLIVVETDDPATTLNDAKGVHQSFRTEIEAAERAAVDARERRREATLEALEGK